MLLRMQTLVAISAATTIYFAGCSRSEDGDGSTVSSVAKDGADGTTDTSTATGTCPATDSGTTDGGGKDGLALTDGKDGGTTDGSTPAGCGVDGGTPDDGDVPDLPPDDQIEDPAGNNMLVKVTFHGGAGGQKCVKWVATSSVASTYPLSLVKPIANEKKHNDETKQVNPRTISSSYKTVGGRDGYKALAKEGDTFKIQGKLTSCNGATSVDINYTTKIAAKREKIPFSGAALNKDGTGIGKDDIVVQVKAVKKKKKK